MDDKKKIEIPFGAFDSELVHQEINIPKGFKATIEGDKIILTRAERGDEKVRKALVEMVHDTTGDELWVDYNVHKEEALAWLEKQGECHISHDDEIMIKQLTEYFTTGHGLQNTNETVVEWLNDVKEKLEKQAEVVSDKDDIEAEEKGIRKAFNKIWEEKQDKQKSQRMISAEAKEAMYDKPADKAKPKFKVGDWITNGDYTWKIVEIKSLDYILQSQDGNIVDDSISHVDEQFHSFTIQDAKDGDVIACENGRIGIFKCLNDNLFSSYCFIDNEGWFCGDEGQMHMLDTIICGEIYPATKEQRDLLFSKMNEAGYVWDADKKELKKIEQKSAWSEEDDDDTWMNDIISKVENNLQLNKAEIDWLKSLKDRAQPQNCIYYNPYKEVVESIAEMCKHYDKASHSGLRDFYDNVNVKCKDAKEYDSLFPQNTWKPSDEQMADLWNMLCECRPADLQLLLDIYYGLKKLRGDKL